MKHFSTSEANEALEWLRPMVEGMVGHRREVVRVEEEIARLQSSISGNGGGLDRSRLADLERRAATASSALARSIEEIEALGVQVKDLDRGLVDFPASHPVEHRTVLLCWQLGEESVGHWHGLEEGFAGRKPLPF